jgi:4-amino-4-deoxy-L-arabinose transferase-like glycosyltransferase
VSARASVALVLVAWALAALPATWHEPVRRAAQARAVAVARTMADTGDLAVPRYNGEVRLKKPPLQSWVQAGTMSALRTREPWAAGLGTWVVGMLFALGPWMLGAACGRPHAGLLGSLLLCATRATTWWGASPEHDVPFAGLVAASLAALVRALGPGSRPGAEWLAGLSCGAAVLVKGPFALAFVLGTAIVAVALPPRGAPRPRLRWVPSLVGALLPAAAWLAVVAARVGGVGAVFDEIGRQAGGDPGAHVPMGASYVLWYVAAIPAWSLPVSAFGLVALLWALARRSATAPPRLHGLRVPAVATVVTFVALTATPAKQAHYLLPILPPLFLLFAAALEETCAGRPRLERALPVVVLVGAAVLLGSRIPGAVDEAGLSPWPPAIAGGVVVAVAGTGAACLGRRAVTAAVLIAGLGAAALTGIASALDAVRFRITEDYADSAADLAEQVDASLPLVGYARGAEREEFNSLAVAMGRPFARESDVEGVRRRLAAGASFHLLVLEIERDDVTPFADRLTPLGRLSPRRPGSTRDPVWLYLAR